MTTDELRAKFEAWMKSREGYPFAGQFANIMWTAYQAALLRERESAKAVVTEEMVEVAVNAHAEWFGGHRGMRAASEAIAPMLASARVPDLENALRMVVAANAMLSEIEDGKTLYEGSPTHSTRCLLAWDNLNTAIANAKHVLSAATKPETEE